jgi:hypothetical protein
VTEPEPLEALVAQAKRTRDALDRVVAEPPAPPPEGETPAERLSRRWNEQAASERADEALERQVTNANPVAPPRDVLADPLREVARAQRARPRRRRGRVP